MAMMYSYQGEQSGGAPPPYKNIERNEFSYRKHIKQKEEDISVCECKFDASDEDSACGEQCWNVMTNTECTPGYCPCGSQCKNQRFQNCQYAKTRLFKTEGRGWGLLAEENIEAGEFIIEYCGEVISSKEGMRRSLAYEAEELKDAYIISLNAQESIDATKKGSLARFINHSCQPNCETRKWNVLGEVRVGIFAKQNIPAGTELAYNYNFEWFGGEKVRCLCGASCCSGFLGAKSRGFQEAAYNWEDDDDRFSVENIPIYDTEEDESTSQPLKAIVPLKDDMVTERGNEDILRSSDNYNTTQFCDSTIPITIEPLNSVEPQNSVPMETDTGKFMQEEHSISFFATRDAQPKLTQKSTMVSRIRSNSACRNYQIQPSALSKTPQYSGGRSKKLAKKQVNVKFIADRLSSEACAELLAYEEMKDLACSQLNSLYDEIRPAIEEHERDSQDSVSTAVAERWIEASCSKLKSEFDLYASLIKHIASSPRRARNDVGDGMDTDIKYLENGN